MKVYPTNSINKITSFFGAIKRGWELIERKEHDVVVAQDPIITGSIGLILSKIFKKKLLVGIFGSDIFDPFLKLSLSKKLKKFIGIFVLNRSDAVQVDGPEIFEILKIKYPDKIFLKPMVPPDISVFREIIREQDSGPLRVLYVGRMAHQKNIPMLSRVLETCSKDNTNITFTVIGDGPEKHKLKGKFKYVQTAKREEMLEHFKNNDLLILTSFYEGFPRIFMEAAASGMPILTTRVSGIKDMVIDNETGYIIEQGDAAGLAEKILHIDRNRNVLAQMSKKIRDIFDRRLSFDVNIKTQAEIFKFLKTR